MQNKFFVLIAATLLGLVFSSSAQNLGIQPTTLNFTLGKGQTETQVISISNSSPKKVQYRVYLNDWLRDENGGHLYFRPDTLPRSCAKWLSINKNFIEIEPGKATQLTVKMQVPDSASAVSGMRWAMLFIETVEEQVAPKSKQAQATVHNLLRLGVHIYQTPPTVTNKEVKILDLKPAGDMPNTYKLYCQNTGGVMLECKSYLEITGSDGKKFKLNPVEFPLFPEQKRYVTFELPKNLPKAKYSVLAVVDGGEDMSLEAIESEIEVK